MRPAASPFMIRLREIPPGGLKQTYDLAGDFTREALAGTAADAGLSAVHADVELQHAGRDVYTRARLSGQITLPCSRCLAEAQVPVDARFEVTFVPASEGEEPAELELAGEVLDVKPYSDDEIDLEATLREELLLAMPLAPLCREGCKGLCAQCGKDLNEGPCDCRPQPPDDRWQALKNVKL